LDPTTVSQRDISADVGKGANGTPFTIDEPFTDVTGAPSHAFVGECLALVVRHRDTFILPNRVHASTSIRGPWLLRCI
jgi:hypothetical protein